MNTKSEKDLNPLLDYTRRETIFISLPSRGKNQDNNLTLTSSKEVGIKPMSTADEISMTTPEALFNGEALVQVIKSCVPAVVDPRKLLAPDVDAILVGIRLASYGDEMEIKVKCPECEFENYFDSPIRHCIDEMNFLEDEYKITLSEKVSNVSVSLRPFTFDENIKEALFQFKETKALDIVIQKEFSEDDELQKKYNEIVTNISTNNIDLISGCIVGLFNSDGDKLEAKHEHILEWLTQLPSTDATTIISKVSEINKIGIHKTISIQCQECEHVWTADLNFDPTSFFGKGS